MSRSPVKLSPWRKKIRLAHLADESRAVARLLKNLRFDHAQRAQVETGAAELVKKIRTSRHSGLMETFLAEYGLSTREGIALMCLAEALLRVPDAPTIDALIQDKIVAADWGRHLGHSASPLVNASTWALMLPGKVISTDDKSSTDLLGTLHAMIKRVGDPVVRNAVKQAMRVLGQQFVLGQTIDEALQRGAPERKQGYTHSYDMLGEAALTADDARQYFLAYSSAITSLAAHCKQQDIRSNPGISVKLSALHPRYEFRQHERAVSELVARVGSLALLAKNANMGFNIDAEEAERLDISLDIIEQVLQSPDLAGWDGFGVVVQAYAPRALAVIDWLNQLAIQLDRRIMVRLVKGAYWDSEIKLAQQQGLAGYPVFTRKITTDVSYLACAQLLLDYSPQLYPQFATHNAHSVMAVLQMAGECRDFEFQRLHGMGESLYHELKRDKAVRCRIYAPVGVHRDLLAYLVRRLLENGANSSFVNQLMDESVPPRQLVADPVKKLATLESVSNPKIPLPEDLYAGQRLNSSGWNLSDPITLRALLKQRDAFAEKQWFVTGNAITERIINPADFSDTVGALKDTSPKQLEQALQQAVAARSGWAQTAVEQRAKYLCNFADALQENAPELIMLMAREAGKTLEDGISEVREAVDFCRYYGAEMQRISLLAECRPRGIFVCISPWNFPLAIFSGQIAAALVSGNVVIAKPAEQTPLIALRAVELMHAAGIPPDVLQCLPGDGVQVGAALVSDTRIDGVCFTGSTETAQSINRAIAGSGNPQAVLIAETGGLNAMIVDSSALLQQAVKDIISSAFQSAGQRCSALRILFVQSDIADDLMALLKGAMDECRIGDPRELAHDMGPLIDAEAQAVVQQHCEKLTQQGRLIHQNEVPPAIRDNGHYVAASVFELDNFEQLEREIFGPVLHLVRYQSDQLDVVIETINARGYGLTLGIHSRVDERVQRISARAKVGNIYVNRNQIGAVVGSQPFGGEGLSGTGPKAGGPHYLYRFMRHPDTFSSHASALPSAITNAGKSSHFSAQVALAAGAQEEWSQSHQSQQIVERVIQKNLPEWRVKFSELKTSLREFSTAVIDLPGPTGESNRLSLHGRGVIVCLGAPGQPERLPLQILLALYLGNAVIAVKGEHAGVETFCKQLFEAGISSRLLRVVDHCSFDDLIHSDGIAGVILEQVDTKDESYRRLRQALAARDGAIISLIETLQDWRSLMVERALCIDTTASGGNTELLAAAG
jgi:RHH-type proline utilization regulon transcriptional repressor/proline dehydrogenase/delta 1-pyrroline-5-carboxylate dehydrogenase